MQVVADTDIVSTFAKVERLDILNQLFDQVIIPPSVGSELAQGSIDIRRLKVVKASLSRQEIKTIKSVDARLGRGERECFVIAKLRTIPAASNDRLFCRLCEQQDIGFLTLPRIIRLAIVDLAITRKQARELVMLIEQQDNTVIKNKDDIFG